MTKKNDILNTNNGTFPQNIKDLFEQESVNKQVTIQLKLHQMQLCELKFDIDTLGQPDKNINKVVATTVEELLNQLPQLEIVQNKI